MLRALIFDFNGVLVDDEPLHFRLFQRVMGEEGLDLPEESYFERFLGFDDRDCLTAVLTEAGESSDTARVMRLIARKAAYYREEIRREGYPFFAGGLELVDAAASRGWILALVSGALRDEVEGALDQAGRRELFKTLVTAEDVTHGKPHPEGYRRALHELNSLPPLPERLLHPHEVAAIEDSPAGLEAAHVAGLRTIGITHTYEADRLAEAEAVVEDLTAVTPEDLESLLA